MNEIVLIGFEQASITNDLASMIRQAGGCATVVTPDNFFKNQFNPTSQFITTVTRDLNLRRDIINKFNVDQLSRGTFIHDSCYIDPKATVKPGTFICPFCTVAYNATVDSDCIIGPYSFVSHNSYVGSGTLIHPGTMIAGSTKIGQNCQLNFRSSIIDNLDICDNVVIGAGALVTKNIDRPGFYVGAPARKVS